MSILNKNSDWHIIGDQSKEPHDPTIGDKRMAGSWTITWENNKMKYKDFYEEELNEINKIGDGSQIEESWKSMAAAGLLGAASLIGGSSDAKTTTTKQQTTATIKDVQPFIDYIKDAENGIREGFDKKTNKWYPHKSFEGGADTIAYGHKIKRGENFSGGITEKEALELLQKDLKKAKSIVNKETKGVKLTPKQEEMFVDFVFNMGTLKKFPKFVVATLKNDINTMRKEYKRYSGGKELKNRNTAFYNRYLNDN